MEILGDARERLVGFLGHLLAMCWWFSDTKKQLAGLGWPMRRYHDAVTTSLYRCVARRVNEAGGGTLAEALPRAFRARFSSRSWK